MLNRFTQALQKAAVLFSFSFFVFPVSIFAIQYEPPALSSPLGPSEHCALQLLDLVLFASASDSGTKLAHILGYASFDEVQEFFRTLPPRHMRALYGSGHPDLQPYLRDYERTHSISVITDEEFEAVAMISEKLLSSFSEAETIYVGIGRSPAPFLAYLNAKEIQTYMLPLSSFKRGESLSTEMSDKLYRHLDEYYPAEHVTAGKSVVLIDFAFNGSIFFVKDNIDRYLRARGRSLVNHLYILTNRIEVLKPMFPEGDTTRTDFFNIGRSVVHAFLISHGFDGLAEYGKYNLAEDDKTLQNPRHEILKREFIYRTQNQTIQRLHALIPKSLPEKDYAKNEFEKTQLIRKVSELSICSPVKLPRLKLPIVQVAEAS